MVVSGASMQLQFFPDPRRQAAAADRPLRRTSSGPGARQGPAPLASADRSAPQPLRGPAADAEDFDLHLLALGRVKGVGVHALRVLIDHAGGDLARIWHEDTPTLGDVLAKARVREARKVATAIGYGKDELLADGRRERDALAAEQVRLIGMHDSAFPRPLAELPDAPYWLFVQGNPAALSSVAHIAIVGTRDATPLGVKTAERLAHFVVKEGLGIVSGLAEGIDAAAHRVAAYYDVPQVAVLGTGIRQVFPTSTGGLRKRILGAHGAVITEYLPDEKYGKANFVQRNRIQAGLASAVCPVEGRIKGGTAHTVTFAERYRRALFGVYRRQLLPSNELAAQFAKQGRPVFGLDTDLGVADLRLFLHGIAGPRAPIPSRPAPEALFHEVLRALDDLAEDVAVTPFDANWLMGRIARRFGLREPDPVANGHGNVDGGPGHGG